MMSDNMNVKGYAGLSTILGSAAALSGASAISYPVTLLTPVAVVGAIGLGATSAKFSLEGLKKYLKESHPKSYKKFISLSEDTQKEIFKNIDKVSDYLKSKEKITKKKLKEVI